MKIFVFVFLSTAILCFNAPAHAEGLNCEGFGDAGLHCSDNGAVADANKVNENFKYFLKRS